MSALPHGANTDAVLAALDSCDRTTVLGRRDFAVLTLMALLGWNPAPGRRRLDRISRHRKNRNQPRPLPTTRRPQRIQRRKCAGSKAVPTRHLYLSHTKPPRAARRSHPAEPLCTARVSEAELLPGDLVFYGNPNTKIHHVGLYIDAGQMIDAPTFGKPVGVRPIRYRGDDFVGGGRVALRPVL